MLEQPSFGRRLRQLRTERGLSQAALVGDGMSTGYLSRLESGARQPTERAVAFLAERLGVQPADFTEPKADSLAQALTVATSAETDDAILELACTLRLAGEGDRALRWQALWLLSRTKHKQGERAAELGHLEELVELGDELGLPELRTRACTKLAQCLRSMGEIARAAEAAEAAYRIARDSESSVRDTAGALLALVSVEAEAGRLAEARAHADELCDLTHDLSGTLPIEAMWTASTVRFRQGDHAMARVLLERALERMSSHDGLLLWMRLRLAASSLYLQLTPPATEAARERLEEVEPVLGLIGTALHCQELTTLQAHLAFHEGRFDDARGLHDALHRAKLRLTFRDRVRLDVLYNRLLAHEGRVDEAAENLRALGDRTHKGSNVDLAAEIWRVLAEILSADRLPAPRSAT
ncbi:DNA-binding protein [Streptomyces eurocidicus]|uniref:DNA-binding protein n=1 Tax=Streptomyces eurocidicus TaxID=66423 RepID=A0A2N8NVN3_STREU|nr:helix-turn-helix domain-containing protein [Streptomyces eurocidicus]MBB5123145.1 transcriptional regulator with XRE-family HTH domain [Streptomyces eurocidicus]MBF6056666.1 helix-turn-helix domain-containing protein [Streptomyces eurocidicus]PNE32838.1 DNA-binding protein [Streptomyces eurocidicus]